MSEYTVTTAQVAIHAKKLEAEAVDTVVFSTLDVQTLEILFDGTAAIYYTIDGSTPTVGGQNCRVLPAGLRVYELGTYGVGSVTIKLISAGTPVYSIQESA